MLKVLTYDIETMFDTAAVWGAWKQNVSPAHVLSEGRVVTYAAKFLHEDHVWYDSAFDLDDKSEKSLLKSFAKLVRKADIVVAHNGDNFDMKWLRTQMVRHGLKPIAPVKQVDTLKIAKQLFRFRHNRLDFVAKQLGCTPKSAHANFPGHKLWDEVYKGNPAACKEMLDYNIQDVLTLEEVYLKLRPWTKGGAPNVSLDKDRSVPTCPKCGGKHLHKRGFAYTGVSKFQRYQCTDCGGWSRGRVSLIAKDARKNIMMNVA